jgi:transcriptional regulator with XRE-family HTH domain
MNPVRELRRRKHLTQTQLAAMLQSSQRRVAEAEAADETVSLDLLIRSLLALGLRIRILRRFL